MMKCVIIDDEPLAREGIADYVREVDFLQLEGVCEHPLELMTLMDKTPVDLIFLDIQMPKMNGIDFLKIVRNPPMVIITTAYPSYALEGFQLNVLDYLVKPVTFDRFFKSANKAKDYHRLVTKSASADTTKSDVNEDYFFIKCGSKYEKIFFDDILFIEGMQNYVIIYTDKGKYVTLLYMKNLEQNLDSRFFIRVHKSYIVALSAIKSIDGNIIQLDMDKGEVPLGSSYKDALLELVGGR